MAQVDAYEDRLADAIVAELKGISRGWHDLFVSECVEPERTRTPWYEANEILKLKVAVVPDEIERNRESRGTRAFKYSFDIELQKSLEPQSHDADCQMRALSRAAEQIHDFFDNGHELTGMPGWVCLKADREQVYAIETLFENHIWWTAIKATIWGAKSP